MEQNLIRIEEGPTRATIHINRHNPYAHIIQSITHSKLTDYEFNPRLRRYVVTRKFLCVDPIKDTVCVPINVLACIIEQLEISSVPYQLVTEPSVTIRPMQTKMVSSFVPKEHQVAVIDNLSSILPHRKGLAIQTGAGKTVSSIAACVKYGAATMIIVSGLQDQWVESIFKFTTATKDKVYLVQGIKSLQQLMESELKPDFIVFSLETLRLYCQGEGNYADLPPYSKFVSYFGIGSKIMDEVHLNFHAATQIDLKSNIANNIYLTATFTSSSSFTKKIFNVIYPADMRYGESTREHYIDTYLYSYSGNVPERVCVKMRGYNHGQYEEFLLKKPIYLREHFNDLICMLINQHYIAKKNPGEKLVIYFARLDMIDKMYEMLSEKYPDLNIGKYVQGASDDVHKKNDIILTTPKSCGCGVDIKNLRIVINTISLKAETLVLQMKGRLRKLNNDIVPEYIEIHDTNLDAHRRHYEERFKIHRASSKNLTVTTLP